MKQSLRHQKIVELVKQKGYLSTEELVALFGVSPQTIRRDLNELAETNFIRRHRLLRRKIAIITIANTFFLKKKTVSQDRLCSSSQTVHRYSLTSALPPKPFPLHY